ncbi:MAG: YibE/F family protein, partial [Eubacteriales bacterium]|nr:YibE/F family protein [Eubacteriales bacterium]
MVIPNMNSKIRHYAPTAVCIALIALLLLLPTGFEGAAQYQDAERCVVRIVETDESAIFDTGLVRTGEQRCAVEILSGAFKGRQSDAVNLLRGSLEQDKLFSAGDKAQAVISSKGSEIVYITLIDHYRLPYEWLLAGIFALSLAAFAGRTGLRALLSFVLTILFLWKLLVPLYLKGYNPVWAGLCTLAV